MEAFRPEPTRPEWPPDDVWREVDMAARTWKQLHARGFELHFDLEAGAGGLVIQLRDLDGHVLRDVAPSEAVRMASRRAA
jgi:hypothetical protein